MEIGGELWSVVIHFAVEGRLRVQPRFLTLATFSRVAARASERWEDCFRSANDSRCCRRDATMFRWRMQERPLSILSRSPTCSMQACFGTVRCFAWDGVASNSSRPFCHVTVGSVTFLWLSCSNRSVRHPFAVVWVSFVPDGSFRGNGTVLYRGLDLQGRHALVHDVAWRLRSRGVVAVPCVACGDDEGPPSPGATKGTAHVHAWNSHVFFRVRHAACLHRRALHLHLSLTFRLAPSQSFPPSLSISFSGFVVSLGVCWVCLSATGGERRNSPGLAGGIQGEWDLDWDLVWNVWHGDDGGALVDHTCVDGDDQHPSVAMGEMERKEKDEMERCEQEPIHATWNRTRQLWQRWKWRTESKTNQRNNTNDRQRSVHDGVQRKEDTWRRDRNHPKRTNVETKERNTHAYWRWKERS